MSDIHARLLKASGANSLSLIARVAEQLLLVPIFLSAWSVELYGEWLLIAAIPIYLSLSDMGFVSAGSNELARRGGVNDETSIRQFFTDYVSFFLRWSIMIMTLIILLAAVLPLDRWLGLELLSQNEAAIIFALLACSTLLSQNGLTLLAGLRVKKLFHAGLLILALAALIRLTLTYLAVMAFGAGPVTVAVLTLCVAVASYATQSLILRQAGLPPVWKPLRRTSEQMLPYLGLGLEFMLMPLAQAIMLQGMVIMVGTTLGAVAVAAFSTHRTLTRFTSQVLQLAVTPLRAEAGLLQSAEDKPQLRSILLSMSRLTFWLSLVSALVLMIAGPGLFAVWTSGTVDFLPSLFLALILSTILEGIWRIGASIRLGTNQHRPVVWAYLGLSLIGLALAWFLAQGGELSGIALALVATDAVMCIWVVRVTAPLIDVSTQTYLRSILTLPTRELIALKSRLIKGVAK